MWITLWKTCGKPVDKMWKTPIGRLIHILIHILIHRVIHREKIKGLPPRHSPRHYRVKKIA
jgi:hypothetical protein